MPQQKNCNKFQKKRLWCSPSSQTEWSDDEKIHSGVEAPEIPRISNQSVNKTWEDEDKNKRCEDSNSGFDALKKCLNCFSFVWSE